MFQCNSLKLFSISCFEFWGQGLTSGVLIVWSQSCLPRIFLNQDFWSLFSVSNPPSTSMYSWKLYQLINEYLCFEVAFHLIQEKCPDADEIDWIALFGSYEFWRCSWNGWIERIPFRMLRVFHILGQWGITTLDMRPTCRCIKDSNIFWAMYFFSGLERRSIMIDPILCPRPLSG